jgi:putative glutamine amidotransferase
MRPIVGITSYVEGAQWGVWEGVAALLPYAYVRAVTAAGGRAVVLPPDGSGAEVIDALDALVLAGGPDIDPRWYGAPPHPRTNTRHERDGGEVALVTAAMRAGLPTLGVCRGMQLLAVASGGTLHQHLPDLLGHEGHRPGPGVFGSHDVRLAPGSRIATIMGQPDGVTRDAAEVNSYHHQAVADPGGLIATGWADDGVIEAAEDPSQRFLVGVQWHPEETGDLRPFAALVDAAGGEGRPVGDVDRPAAVDGRPVAGERRPTAREGRPAARHGPPAVRQRRPASRERPPTARDGRPRAREGYPS